MRVRPLFHHAGWRVFVLCTALCALAGCPQRIALPELGTFPSDEHVLRLAFLSDIHMVDEESPGRAVRLDPFVQRAWRPHEAYAVQIFDAALAALNLYHQNGFPVDALVIGGDVADNAQFNEMCWFLDTIDGIEVRPDSGLPDGEDRPVAPGLNPKLPYTPGGLDPDIPWYAVLGNHDVLCTGNFAIDRSAPDPADWHAPITWPISASIGLDLADPSLDALWPTGAWSPALIDGWGAPMKEETLQLDLGPLEPGPAVPDEDRHFLSREGIIGLLQSTFTGPAGHGFDAENGVCYYTVRPNPEVPIRLIVLDTAAPDPPEGIPVEYGVLPRAQYEDFLIPALHDAQENGEYVVVVSHHPSEDFNSPYSHSVKTFEFRALLAAQPHVLMHLNGHTHKPNVQEIQGKYAYIELTCPSILDYPGQGWILDFYFDAAEDAVQIEGTAFGPRDAPTLLSEEGVRRAEIDARYSHSLFGEADYAKSRLSFRIPAKGE